MTVIVYLCGQTTETSDEKIQTKERPRIPVRIEVAAK